MRRKERAGADIKSNHSKRSDDQGTRFEPDGVREKSGCGTDELSSIHRTVGSLGGVNKDYFTPKQTLQTKTRSLLQVADAAICG